MRTPGAARPIDAGAEATPPAARPVLGPAMEHSVLAIAGLDPSGGAGLAADLKTISSFRHYGAAVATSITAQNTVGVQAIYDLPMEFVAGQIESVVSDMEFRAVKIGMLGTARTVSIVASLIESLGLRQVVVDPVIRSTSGTPLLEKKGIPVLKERLLPCADVITPNMEEASILTGMGVADLPSMKEAARALHAMGPRYVVVTGGHLSGRAIDVLYDGDRMAIFDSSRIAGGNTHGIGCTFSTAIACLLAHGATVAEAVDGAKRYVSRAAAGGPKIGKGSGPLNHLIPPS